MPLSIFIWDDCTKDEFSIINLFTFHLLFQNKTKNTQCSANCFSDAKANPERNNVLLIRVTCLTSNWFRNDEQVNPKLN